MLSSRQASEATALPAELDEAMGITDQEIAA
jgi:hypothetical protein